MVGGLPPKPNPDPDPENKSEEIDDDELVQSEETQEEVLPTTEPRAEAEKVEPTLSKKNTDQYLLWPDVDPEPVQSEQTVKEETYVDPNQLELDFLERLEGETEEEYNKRVWKSQNPGLTINAVKKLYDTGTLDQLPWEKNKEVDTTINSMKEEGDWPKIQDDLEAWNEWVEKANEEAEKNPENPNKTQYTEVIEPQGFNQNEEQKDDSVWSKINQARNNINLEKIKELEITEEQYRNASQRHIIKLIERLKAGIITVDELSNVDANKINDMLKREKN